MSPEGRDRPEVDFQTMISETFSAEETAQIERFVEFLGGLSDEQRSYMLDFVKFQAENFYRELDDKLPTLREVSGWEDRLVQDILRGLSYRELGWGLLREDKSIVQELGKNLSGRGRAMLKEELEAIRSWKQRSLQRDAIREQDVRNQIEHNKLEIRLLAYKLRQELER